MEVNYMKYKVAFVCVHNSCRSQMAEGWANKLGEDIFKAYSAGTRDYKEVKPLAIKVMQEVGVDIRGHKPKLLSEIPQELDILITMGCNVVCPFVPNSYMEDWGIEDPSGLPIENFREARDLIKKKVEELIIRIKANEVRFN